MSRSLKPDDPCYWMLEQGRNDPSKRSTPTVFDVNCYICKDEEFALMGLPLCYPCMKCKGHVPADDTICTVCGHDCQDDGPGPEDDDESLRFSIQ